MSTLCRKIAIRALHEMGLVTIVFSASNYGKLVDFRTIFCLVSKLKQNHTKRGLGPSASVQK